MADPTATNKAIRAGRAARWGLRATALGLVTLNAWWAWGDWSPPAMKTIDGLLARGKLDEAEPALASRLRWSSGDGDARMKLARLLVKRGDHLGGARQLHLVPAWWPSRGEASFLEGQAFKLADRARDAEAAFLRCIADDPLHPLAPTMFHGAAKDLVALYILESRLDDARKTLWRAFDEATPAEKPGVLATRVRAELERIDHQQAATRLLDYVAGDPEDHEARRALAVEEHAIGDEAAADRDIEACLKARPDDPLTWRAMLDILNERGDVDTFREVIDRLPASTDGDAKVWMHRGLARQRDGDNEGALQAFQRSAALDPNDPEIAYKLGMAEMAVGKADVGREHLALSRQIHKSYGDLRDAYHAFLEQSARTPRDQAAYRETVERLATHCRALGYAREADAWLALPPPE